MTPDTLDPCIVKYSQREGYDVITMLQPSGYVQRMRCHSYGTCVNDEACGIHNPSEHPLNDAPLYWRSDRGLMERTCPHGIGHPDPDHVRFVLATRGAAEARTVWLHGDTDGCGCCGGAYEFLLGEDEVADKFVTKDSGERQQFGSGMVRDTDSGKPRFDLIVPEIMPYDETMLYRWAALMGRGAEKYGDRNWEKAAGEEELKRARGSVWRHFMQWYHGEEDEDHASAIFFNVAEIEYIKWRMDNDV